MQEFFQLGVYKKSQGRIARQVTCAVVWAAAAILAWRIWITLGAGSHWRYLICGVTLLVGLWIGYRLVNIPQFADFLIAVEAEMNKVSWPSRDELIRSSVVVIFVIFLLAAVLFGYDLVWQSVVRVHRSAARLVTGPRREGFQGRVCVELAAAMDPEFEGVKVAGDPDSRDELASEQARDEPVPGAPSSSEAGSSPEDVTPLEETVVIEDESAEDAGTARGVGRRTSQAVPRPDAADAGDVPDRDERTPRARGRARTSQRRADRKSRRKKRKKKTSSSGTFSRCR